MLKKFFCPASRQQSAPYARAAPGSLPTPWYKFRFHRRHKDKNYRQKEQYSFLKTPAIPVYIPLAGTCGRAEENDFSCSYLFFPMSDANHILINAGSITDEGLYPIARPRQRRASLSML